MSADPDDYEEPMIEDVRECKVCGTELFANEGYLPDDLSYGRCNDCIPGGAYFY
jgi:hypothetical protein